MKVGKNLKTTNDLTVRKNRVRSILNRKQQRQQQQVDTRMNDESFFESGRTTQGMYACICMCVCMNLYICMCIFMWLCMYVVRYVCVCVCVCVCV